MNTVTATDLLATNQDELSTEIKTMAKAAAAAMATNQDELSTEIKTMAKAAAAAMMANMKAELAHRIAGAAVRSDGLAGAFFRPHTGNSFGAARDIMQNHWFKNIEGNLETAIEQGLFDELRSFVNKE